MHREKRFQEAPPVLAASQISTDLLPVAPEGKGGVSVATKAAVQEAIKHAQELAMGNTPFNIDTRPVSKQLSE